MNPPVTVITRGDIARALPIKRTLELARIAYEATATGGALNSSLGYLKAPDGEFHIKGSGLLLDDRLFAAVKVAAFFEQRPETLGLPSIVGLIQLFDGATGQPLAIMESGFITDLRTAAGTAVALNELARHDARRLLVCGAGGQALPHLEAIAAIRDLDSVQLWGRSPARTEATLAQIAERLPHLQPTLASDLRAAAHDSDLIICLTPATEPYLDTSTVRPGTTIAAVGSDTPEKRELSVDLLASSEIVCDVTHQCAQVGELHHALDAGAVALTDCERRSARSSRAQHQAAKPPKRSSSSTRPEPQSKTLPQQPSCTSRPPQPPWRILGQSDHRAATDSATREIPELRPPRLTRLGPVAASGPGIRQLASPPQPVTASLRMGHRERPDPIQTQLV